MSFVLIYSVIIIGPKSIMFNLKEILHGTNYHYLSNTKTHLDGKYNLLHIHICKRENYQHALYTYMSFI